MCRSANWYTSIQKYIMGEKMQRAWRWCGPSDRVLSSNRVHSSDIRQAGATDVVTALHHVTSGALRACAMSSPV
ncbi:MAG: hypothetical protein CMN41_06830 [SAR116 cluster bacterium]|nr:hypothetical protein [SAR116 cluster bacterium]